MLISTPVQESFVLKIAPVRLAKMLPQRQHAASAMINISLVFIWLFCLVIGFGFGLFPLGILWDPLEFICRWDFLLVERTRSRQKWRQEECGRALVCEEKLRRRPPWRGRERSANRDRSQ